jgi:type VI protein secretion system component VasF
MHLEGTAHQQQHAFRRDSTPAATCKEDSTPAAHQQQHAFKEDSRPAAHQQQHGYKEDSTPAATRICIMHAATFTVVAAVMTMVGYAVKNRSKHKRF